MRYEIYFQQRKKKKQQSHLHGVHLMTLNFPDTFEIFADTLHKKLLNAFYYSQAN